MMDWSPFAAVLFDLDGVITPTADVHRRAWTDMFNGFLAGLDGQQPFTDDDYVKFVDGKPRADGVRSFLSSRSIDLPDGDADDPAAAHTVAGLGTRKNDRFNEILQRDGVDAYPGSIALLDALKPAGLRLAIVSSSRNARRPFSSRAARSIRGDRRRQRRRRGTPRRQTRPRLLPPCGGRPQRCP